MKSVQAPLIFISILLLSFTAHGQYTFANDMIKQYDIVPSRDIIHSKQCINEYDQTAVITTEVDQSTAWPYLTFTLFDDDYAILTQQTITVPNSKAAELWAYDIQRLPKSAACGQGYVVVGKTSTDGGQTQGIIIILDDSGTYLQAMVYPELTECRAVAVSSDGLIMVANHLFEPQGAQAYVLKVDCNLNFVWGKQINNYSGSAECYVQYLYGSTTLTEIASLGKDLYAIAGTAWWMVSPMYKGDMNVVAAMIDNNGNITWENTYGNAGLGERSEESCTSMVIDTSIPERLQIVILGEARYKSSFACSTDTSTTHISNILFTIDNTGNINWARAVAQTDKQDRLRRFTDVTMCLKNITVSAADVPVSSLYAIPAIYHFDHWGSFIAERYYDNALGSYNIPAYMDLSQIHSDSYGNASWIGKQDTSTLLIIQSYPNISSSCDMRYEKVDITTVGMPSIDLPQLKINTSGAPIRLVADKDQWLETIHCSKKW
jgi:hypothetical protein